MSMAALGVSTAFMVGCCVAAQIGRVMTRRYFQEDGLLPVLFNEGIAAAELCACCFELIIGNFYRVHNKTSTNLN